MTVTIPRGRQVYINPKSGGLTIAFASNYFKQWPDGAAAIQATKAWDIFYDYRALTTDLGTSIAQRVFDSRMDWHGLYNLDTKSLGEKLLDIWYFEPSSIADLRVRMVRLIESMRLQRNDPNLRHRVSDTWDILQLTQPHTSQELGTFWMALADFYVNVWKGDISSLASIDFGMRNAELVRRLEDIARNP